jgi:hypothetical protein
MSSMQTKQLARMACLVASTLLPQAVGTAPAQQAPQPGDNAAQQPPKVNQGGAVPPRGYLTTLSIFFSGSPKQPAPAGATAQLKQDPLPAPRPADVSQTPPRSGDGNGARAESATACAARPLSWWKRCRVNFWNCWGYESEFEPEPLGASVYTTYRNHVANGVAARMVLYRYDFVDGSSVLNTRGQDHLAKIAAVMAHNAFAVIVERLPSNPALAEARRLAVLNQLGRGGIAIPSERVVVGAPIANGLLGGEAEIIYQNLLSQTRERGLVTGAASGFVGAATSPTTAGGGTGGGTGVPSTPR